MYRPTGVGGRSLVRLGAKQSRFKSLLITCGYDDFAGKQRREARMVVYVAGEELGSCSGALHKQAARMLAAQDALRRWPPPAAVAAAAAGVKLRKKRKRGPAL